MFVKNFSEVKKTILKILETPPSGRKGNLVHVAKDIEKKTAKIINIIKKHPTPFYLIDNDHLQKNIGEFSAAFKKYLPSCQPCYAVKSNHHPYLLKSAVQAGWGLEVASGRELLLSLKHDPPTVLFNGPGKTDEELTLALKHNNLVTVNIDSFGELKRLGALAKKQKKQIRAGVRIITKHHKPWNQFGISLENLKEFFNEAKKYKFIKLEGIHFHLSWNRNPDKYKKIFEELGRYLKINFSQKELSEIKFIDFGGGFYPNAVEGYYPWTTRYSLPMTAGALVQFINSYYHKKSEFQDDYFLVVSDPIEKFAKEISRAIKKYISPILKNCMYYTEPGRIICSNAMSVVVKVMDYKSPDAIITNGGVNISGWEYGELFYYPIINLNDFSLKEIKATIFGNLCTPHDIWGYFCYAKKIKEGDHLLITNQGAYRYSLAQEFIKAIPPVYVLK